MDISMISEINTLLSNYNPQNETEKQYKARMMAFLNNSNNPLFSDNEKGHFTASAWVLSSDSQSVLLTEHTKLGKWFQLGGHIEKSDDSFVSACLREATEESGIVGLCIDDAFVLDLDIHTIPLYKGIAEHPHFDITFCFRAPENAKTVTSMESLNLEWVPIVQVKSKTDDAAIARMTDKTLLSGANN
jgi:8-oxo-dGTP pyrophosphatase MutT (NUDIX family)